MTRRKLRGDNNTHDHTQGTSVCAACKAEDGAEREGGITWTEWIHAVFEQLGTPKTAVKLHEKNLARLGIDEEDATRMWSRNLTPGAYIKLRGLKAPTPLKTSKKKTEITRLFDTDTETTTQLGQAASMHIGFALDNMLTWLLEQDPNASVRDFQLLIDSHLHMKCARIIVERQRKARMEAHLEE